MGSSDRESGRRLPAAEGWQPLEDFEVLVRPKPAPDTRLRKPARPKQSYCEVAKTVCIDKPGYLICKLRSRATGRWAGLSVDVLDSDSMADAVQLVEVVFRGTILFKVSEATPAPTLRDLAELHTVRAVLFGRSTFPAEAVQVVFKLPDDAHPHNLPVVLCVRLGLLLDSPYYG